MNSKEKVNYFGRDLEAMSFATNYYRWIKDEFESYFGENVAEVGAGTGNFSKLIISEKIKNLILFEPSANMYPILKERMDNVEHVNVKNCILSDECHLYCNSFDSVISINTLEHIECDYKEMLSMNMVLKKGGYLLVFVPALSFLYSALDKNLGHF